MTSTYKLKTSVTHNKQTIDSLTFRKLKARDLAAADAVDGQVRKGFAILASMADVSLPVIMDLDMDDLEAAQEVAAPLMGKFGEVAKAKPATEGA